MIPKLLNDAGVDSQEGLKILKDRIIDISRFKNNLEILILYTKHSNIKTICKAAIKLYFTRSLYIKVLKILENLIHHAIKWQQT